MTNEEKQLNDIETLLKQRNRWALKYQELEAVLDKRIAAAVAAEREACAVIADNASSHIVKNAINTQRNQIEWARDRVSEGIAAAIRARGEGERHEA